MSLGERKVSTLLVRGRVAEGSLFEPVVNPLAEADEPERSGEESGGESGAWGLSRDS